MARHRRFDASEWQLAQDAPAPAVERFRVRPADVESSPLRGRLVVAWRGRRPWHGLAGALPAGARLLEPPTGVFDRSLLTLWTDAQWVTHMGPAVMAEPEELAAAMRRLVDTLIDAAADGARVVVDTVESALLSRAMVDSLYPDAVQIDLDVVGMDDARRAVSGLLEEGHGVDRRRAAPSADRPVPSGGGPGVLFVLGSARSGTTWLSSLLQLHPSVGGIGEAETWLFQMLGPLWRAAHDPGSLGAHVDPGTAAGAVRAFCDDLFAAALARHAPGATLFVEKTPGHVGWIDLLGRAYPDGRFLHLVRDGRDVVRSLGSMAVAQHRDPTRAAAAWRDAVAAVRAGAGALPTVLEVRYEDLVADPAGGVASILEWAGLGVDDGLRAAVRARAGERVSTWSGTADTVGAGSWRRLSPWALAQVYVTAGEALLAEGYITPGELRARRRGFLALAARLAARRRLGRAA